MTLPLDFDDDGISLAQARGTPSPWAEACRSVARTSAQELDALLAPLVAEGGTLARSSSPDGSESYFVDNTLRLTVGPVRTSFDRGELHVRREVRRYPRPL